MAAQLEAPSGNYRGQAVRFCAACCRFNTSPDQLCFLCRSTRGHRLIASGLPIENSQRVRVVAAILASAVVAGVIGAVIIQATGFSLLAVGFYVLAGTVAYLLIDQARRRPRCPTCGSHVRTVAEPVPTVTGPYQDVPLVARPHPELYCDLCGPVGLGDG